MKLKSTSFKSVAEETMSAWLSQLTNKGLLTFQAKVSAEGFEQYSALLSKLLEEYPSTTIVQRLRSRGPVGTRLLEEGTSPAAPQKQPEERKIYIRPNAVFGLGISFFVFVVMYIFFGCIMDIRAPAVYAVKKWTFGKEM